MTNRGWRTIRGAMVIFTISLIVVFSGCLGTRDFNPNNGSISTVSSINATEIQGVVFPEVVSFNAVLTIMENGTTFANHSYQAFIDYPNMKADVNITSTYRPGSKLTGNWHFRRIVVENGSSVRIFVAPPAKWMPVPENKTKEIIGSVFRSNPFTILFNLTSGIINCSNCSVRVALSPQDSALLLSPLAGTGKAFPSLEGEVEVKNSTIVSAVLRGVSGGRAYIFTLKVEEVKQE